MLNSVAWSQWKSQPRPDILGFFRKLEKKVLFFLTPSSGNLFPFGLLSLADTYLDLMETKTVSQKIHLGMCTVVSKTTRRYPLSWAPGRKGGGWLSTEKMQNHAKNLQKHFLPYCHGMFPGCLSNVNRPRECSKRMSSMLTVYSKTTWMCPCRLGGGSVWSRNNTKSRKNL